MKLRDRAYEAFTEALLGGRLRPGEFVSQRDLTELLGCPLGAIREAIPRLEAEGLIQVIAQRGLQVASVDLRLVHEAFQLREIVELAAVAHFTRSAPTSAIEAQRAALDAVTRAAGEGIGGELIARAQAIDWGFHDALVAQMGNHLLREVHRVNIIRIRVIMRDRVALSVDTLPPALGEHASVLAAIERRDEGAAVEALRGHLESARHRALGLGMVPPERPQPEAERRYA